MNSVQLLASVALLCVGAGVVAACVPLVQGLCQSRKFRGELLKILEHNGGDVAMQHLQDRLDSQDRFVHRAMFFLASGFAASGLAAAIIGLTHASI